ncbi:MAG: hypothetical protein JRC91_01535 [Deltaproteobacteria bacterium]|nr:hypothetical protein [Deltaproteobacteria bacterium]
MKKKYNFTPEIDEQIRQLYRVEVGIRSVAYKGPVRDLAKRFNMPRWCVSRRALKLGVLPIQKKEPNWSEKEIKILEHNSQYSAKTIQKKLKAAGYCRTEVGIILKRKRMRFLQNLDGYSAQSVATCFGIDVHAVTRWIDKGWLRAERRNTDRTDLQGGDCWYIKNKWIREFVIDSVAVIDFRKIDKYWITDLLSSKVSEL